MRTLVKIAAGAGLAGALALAAATPSLARYGHKAAAIGFGAGAVVGVAAASPSYRNGYYGYYHNRGYDDYGYAYAPGYYGYYGNDQAPAGKDLSIRSQR
jgi:hypothetical protein